jgi:hypothetical protein
MRLVSVIDRIWRGVCAAAKGCKGNTIAHHLNWLLGVALQGLRGAAPKTNYNSPRYPADRRYMNDIIARPLAIIGDWELSAPTQTQSGHMPNSRFDLREWLVPPVLTPIFLVLLVAAAMVIQW